MVGPELAVSVDGKERLRFVDHTTSLDGTRIAFGTSSQATVSFSDISITQLERNTSSQDDRWFLRNGPDFQVRSWIGDRPWLFDGDEPIMLLPVPEAKYINNVKLRPGVKPLLSWNSQWGIENQGAFKDGENENSAITTSGGGDTISIAWAAKQKADRFTTRTRMDVSFNKSRGVYVYDIDSELNVRGTKPFHFRYGYDFEHHTPLDPFGWQYLLVRGKGGKMTYRPLSPFDPGPLNNVEQYHGARIWHGRSDGGVGVSPAVEYFIQPKWQRVIDLKGVTSQRQLNTAVCAAFYDTGVSFAPETARPGDKVRVKYRYTGFPSVDAAAFFQSAVVQDNPRIDPKHHFVFARDQWPTIRFDDALPMDKPWWGGRPFLSGHNARPSYDIEEQDGRKVLRLGPVSYAVAPVGPVELDAGRYLVSAKVKSVNTHGPGGRLEVLALKNADPNGNGYVGHNRGNILKQEPAYIGSGSFDWRDVRFVFDVPTEACGLALGLGNAGTGEFLVSEVSFQKLNANQNTVGTRLLSSFSTTAGKSADGVIWDLRMEEQQGYHVFNYGSSNNRTLELANIEWMQDNGHSAFRFVENPTDRADYPKLGILDRNVRHPVYGKNYAPVKHGAFAIGGHHGGGKKLDGLTLAAWIKPAAEMGQSHHPGKGDIIGYGARRFILGLHGQTAPYKLAARINVNDQFESEAIVRANNWYHVAMTCEPKGAEWIVRVFLDGKQVAQGEATKLPTNATVPDSVVLGAELFYLHSSYYRGLIGRTLVLDRVLNQRQLESVRSSKD